MQTSIDIKYTTNNYVISISLIGFFNYGFINQIAFRSK